jgi:hypothetical protein
MMEFIKDDFDKGKIAIENGGKYDPDYQGAIAISTKASLKYMIAPGALVIISPLLAGLLFGPAAVEGLLAGAIVSGVQVAISASNTGGAWDNCKKEIEKEHPAFKAQMKKEGIDIAALAEKIANTPEGDRREISFGEAKPNAKAPAKDGVVAAYWGRSDVTGKARAMYKSTHKFNAHHFIWGDSFYGQMKTLVVVTAEHGVFSTHIAEQAKWLELH